MFIAIQFPFADSRLFVDKSTCRLPFPSWPLPEPNHEFIRHFGSIKERRRGGLESWPGEETFCDASRAILFPASFKAEASKIFKKKISIICPFRRFLYDGEAVSRLEVGFKIQKRKSDKNLFPMREKDCLALLETILSLPIRTSVRTSSSAFNELIACDKLFAKHYLISTTSFNKGQLPEIEDWWFKPGLPLMLIEYKLNHIQELPKLSKPIELHDKLKDRLFFSRIERKGKKVNVWFFKSHGLDRDFSRRVRMHLFRLHAERECFKTILRLILINYLKPETRSQSSDLLQLYLSDSMRLLGRKTRYGLEQTQLLAEIQKFEGFTNLGERATLLSQLSKIDVRKNIYKNIEKITESGEDGARNIHIVGTGHSINIGQEQKIEGATMTNYEIKFGKNSKISGDFVVADTIQGSFNKIRSSDASQNLKSKLEDLSQKVVDMCAHLPKEQAQEAARDLETLTNEALSANPREKWFKLSAKGLIEAAETVGKMAKPVIDACKAVISIIS